MNLTGSKLKVAIVLIMVWFFIVRPSIGALNTMPIFQQFFIVWIPLVVFWSYLRGGAGKSYKHRIGWICIDIGMMLMIPAYTVLLDGSFANVDIPGAEPDIFVGTFFQDMFGISGSALNIAVYGIGTMLFIITGLWLTDQVTIGKLRSSL